MLPVCHRNDLVTALKILQSENEITMYPIRRPVRATITLYPIGRPVRATITLYPIGRLVIATELTSCSIAAIKFFSTFSSSTDDVTERVGLGAKGLVGGAYDDAIFCSATGIIVEVVGSVVAAETSLDGGMEGGGMLVTVEDGIPLPVIFWEAAEIGVELSKGCLNEPNRVLAAAAAVVVVMVDGGKVMLLVESGAFCTPRLSVVTIGCGFGNEGRRGLPAVGSGPLLVVGKLGRLPPIDNGGKVKDKGFLSKEKVLAKVEDGANVSLAKILLARDAPAVVALTVVIATVVAEEIRTFGCKT